MTAQSPSPEDADEALEQALAAVVLSKLRRKTATRSKIAVMFFEGLPVTFDFDEYEPQNVDNLK